jgi:hypothetical protein
MIKTKAGHRLRAAASRGKLIRLFIVFVFSIKGRQPSVAVDRRHSSATRPSQLKEHSTLKSLCRGTKKQLQFCSTRTKFARGSVRSAARGNML